MARTAFISRLIPKSARDCVRIGEWVCCVCVPGDKTIILCLLNPALRERWVAKQSTADPLLLPCACFVPPPTPLRCRCRARSPLLPQVAKLTKDEVLMVNIGSTSTGGKVLATKGDLAKIQLTHPVCTKENEKIALSRRVEKHWRCVRACRACVCCVQCGGRASAAA